MLQDFLQDLLSNVGDFRRNLVVLNLTIVNPLDLILLVIVLFVLFEFVDRNHKLKRSRALELRLPD